MDKNFKFFKDHYEELVEKYADRYVAIKDEEIIGDYGSFDSAYAETTSTERPGTFLIQFCGEEENAASFAWLNVSFKGVTYA